MIFPPPIAFLLLPAMLVLYEFGRRRRRSGHEKEASPVIDSAIFALFGLLLAFTFSGAVARYDAHRDLIVQETNDIGTAFLRLDLLPPAAQPALRQLFRDYATSRLHLYDSVHQEISPESQLLQRKIWQQSVAASSAPGATPDCEKLLLPALNSMIDITSTRQNAFNMHPPVIIFLLLFAFSLGCAFLAGYSCQIAHRGWFYPAALALTVTLTIYATLEIEFPRQGLIRIQHADRAFTDLRRSME